MGTYTLIHKKETNVSKSLSKGKKDNAFWVTLEGGKILVKGTLLFILVAKSYLKRKSMANTMFEGELPFPSEDIPLNSGHWSVVKVGGNFLSSYWGKYGGLVKWSNSSEVPRRSNVKRSQLNELDEVLFRFFCFYRLLPQKQFTRFRHRKHLNL
ncbi:hypothetical protein CEXT_291141 [Caerostris extrusa]|uniref:Uncharacterized protein n=1 Tax=Caerostris extrusa TaxID=172846 RepID=A0AAV4QPT9_CAEEX|nr:hypothetical protein CEXT_291141 [Caerostris extrusa]